jgi:hypothetical protein
MATASPSAGGSGDGSTCCSAAGGNEVASVSIADGALWSGAVTGFFLERRAGVGVAEASAASGGGIGSSGCMGCLVLGHVGWGGRGGAAGGLGWHGGFLGCGGFAGRHGGVLRRLGSRRRGRVSPGVGVRAVGRGGRRIVGARTERVEHAGHLLGRRLQHRQLVQRLQAQVVQELARGGKQAGAAGGFAVADDLDPAAVFELLDDEELMVTPRMSSMSPRVTGWR